MKRLLFLVLGAAFLIVVYALLTVSPKAAIHYGHDFNAVELEVNEYDLFDLGTADVNADQLLDIFTVNHSALQSLLLAEGSGKFRDALTLVSLDQDRQFPGLEDSLSEPVKDRPGLYIYRTNRWLHFQMHDAGASKPVTGTLDIPWPIVVRKSPENLTVTESVSSAGVTVTRLDFQLRDNESLVLNGSDDIVEVPHHLTLSNSVDLTHVYVGMSKTSPTAREFDLVWRDRHGMAWADFNGDGRMDLAIARGGIKGQLDGFPEPITDELFVGGESRFTDQIAATGLTKGNCPARQVAWIDYDLDGDLDLHVSCGRGTEPHYPDQMFRQVAPGQFVDVASDLGLDYGSATVFAWVDSDFDGAMDLISLEGDNIYHYRNLGGRFEKRPVGGSLNGAQPYKFSVADFDNDGDFDVYAVNGRKSHLLVNHEGTFSLELPANRGLPESGRTANWVDFDNDGLQDLHVIPDGLFRQRPDHTFGAIDELSFNDGASAIVDARCTWFDIDGDGFRDGVVAVQTGPNTWQRIFRKLLGRDPNLSDQWRVDFFRYSGTSANNWLQIDLVGYPQNRQAIGATVRVTTQSGAQTQQVGYAEGSHFGQGHYRLYFGLGQDEVANSVEIHWPDGTIEVSHRVTANTLQTFSYSAQP
jgi:hypothetical protein